MILRQRRFLLQFLLPVLVLVALTAWFRLTDGDIAMLRALQTAAGAGDWQQAESGFWGFMKVYGVIPAFATVLLALVAVFAGLIRARHAHWVRPGVYLFLVLALGSGLISNLLLKDHWGRPRPMHVTELGGTEAFVKILTPVFGGDGKSFPCGHATMGFFFFAVALLTKNKRPVLSMTAAVIALLLGGILGISRMLQGGHFPSDVIYAAAIMWFSSLGLLYAMRLQDFREEPIARIRFHPFKARWAGLLVAAAMLALLAAALVSIPRSRSHSINLESLKLEAGQYLEFDFNGSLQIVADETTRLDVSFDGCGTPKSKAKLRVVRIPEGCKVIERNRGFFTEKNFSATLRLAPGDYLIKCSPMVRRLDVKCGISMHEKPAGMLRLGIPSLTAR